MLISRKLRTLQSRFTSLTLQPSNPAKPNARFLLFLLEKDLIATRGYRSASVATEGEGLNGMISLNDGFKMPMFGLGSFHTEPGQAIDAVAFALQHGYRMIDTAAVYENEKEVGEGMRKSGLKREDIFLTTKLRATKEAHGYDNCLRAVKESLERLGVDYVDLFLIHTPKPGKNIESYDALMKLKQDGLIRSVGVSNFGVHHLEELRKAGRPTPAVNQIELNPFWRKEGIVKYCREHGITVEGYCPLFRGRKNDDPLLNEMAKRYGKSVPQLMIRWSVQKEYITIPKSTKHERILANAQVFDFVISDEDMKTLDTLPNEKCAFQGMGDPTTEPWLG